MGFSQDSQKKEMTEMIGTSEENFSKLLIIIFKAFLN